MKNTHKVFLIATLAFFCSNLSVFAETRSKEIKIIGLSYFPNLVSKCSYSLKKNKDGYLGQFIITMDKKVLWNHDWVTNMRDFDNLLENEPTQPKHLQSWVKGIFRAHYGVKILIQKISKEDIDDSAIEYSAKTYKVSTQNIMDEILSDEYPLVVSYRAEWREDMMNIVYLKSIKKFICFKRGID